VTLPLTLAAIDAAVAAYLVGWSLRRQRRDRARVLVVGVVLAICAVFLAVVGWPNTAPTQPTGPLGPAPGPPV
jgi:predicted PurR-regulated permease PerM